LRSGPGLELARRRSFWTLIFIPQFLVSLSGSFLEHIYTPKTRPHKLIFNLHSLWAHTELAKDLEESTRFGVFSLSRQMVSTFKFCFSLVPFGGKLAFGEKLEPCEHPGNLGAKSNYLSVRAM
jgi:hypothetical protein